MTSFYLLEEMNSSMIIRMHGRVDESQRRKIDPYFDLLPTYGHRYIAQFIHPYIKSKRVLDVGCWTGQLEEIIKKDVASLTAVEPNKDAVIFAKSHHPGITFRVASANHLPFADNSFDVVLFLDVLEHIPQNTEQAVLAEICRVLRKEGKLILTTPHTQWLSVLLDPAYFLIGHRHYRENNLSLLLKKAKLSIVSIKKYGGLAHLIKCLVDVIAKHAIHQKIDIYPLLKKQIEREFLSGGFASLFVVAKKRRDAIL